MLKKVLTALSPVIALTLLFAVACDSLRPAPGEGPVAKAAALPVLDTQTPAVIETATFALG